MGTTEKGGCEAAVIAKPDEKWNSVRSPASCGRSVSVTLVRGCSAITSLAPCRLGVIPYVPPTSSRSHDEVAKTSVGKVAQECALAGSLKRELEREPVGAAASKSWRGDPRQRRRVHARGGQRSDPARRSGDPPRLSKYDMLMPVMGVGGSRAVRAQGTLAPFA